MAKKDLEGKANNFFEKYELVQPIGVVQDQKFSSSLGFSWERYIFRAYPGNNVVNAHRAEHKDPYHFHIQARGEPDFRVSVENEIIVELDGQKLPLKLRKLIKKHFKEIARRTRSIYYTGRY